MSIISYTMRTPLESKNDIYKYYDQNAPYWPMFVVKFPCIVFYNSKWTRFATVRRRFACKTLEIAATNRCDLRRALDVLVFHIDITKLIHNNIFVNFTFYVWIDKYFYFSKYRHWTQMWEFTFVNLTNEGETRLFMNLGTNFAKPNRLIFKVISYTRHFRL